MAPYQIWTHPSGAVEATSDGWSWQAFFFNAAWALLRGSWVLGLSVIAALGVMIAVLGTNDIALEIIVYFVLITMLLFGCFGNRLRKAYLKSLGFERYTDIMSPSTRLAVQRFKRSNSL